MNGLFPKEELAVDRWTLLCNLACQICIEKQIDKSDYYPNQHSDHQHEKTIGIALSNYRQGITHKGTTCVYECVDQIITNAGFSHWLLFFTDEEKVIKKWKSRIEFIQQKSTQLDIPISIYNPCQRSDCKIEREIAISLNNYQQALQHKGTHKIYESVTKFIQEQETKVRRPPDGHNGHKVWRHS